MTIDEIRKYAIEKGYPKKFLDDMIVRLEDEYKDGNIDDMESIALCAYIEGQVEYWKRFRKFLDYSREERAKRREERANRNNADNSETMDISKEKTEG